MLEEEGVMTNGLLGDRSKGRNMNIWTEFGIIAQGTNACYFKTISHLK